MCFTTITRDLACWIFTLANPSVRRHYLIEVLHNYATTLTNALALLGINHEKFGVTFHQFCKHFYSETEAVLSRILVNFNRIPNISISEIEYATNMLNTEYQMYLVFEK